MSYQIGQKKVIANCETCGWHLESANAHGVGAIHARAHKHKVYIDVYYVVIYDEET